jgi:hypothetical protein
MKWRKQNDQRLSYDPWNVETEDYGSPVCENHRRAYGLHHDKNHDHSEISGYGEIRDWGSPSYGLMLKSRLIGEILLMLISFSAG